MALARDLVIGPLGGLVGLGGETTVGWATSVFLLKAEEHLLFRSDLLKNTEKEGF
jgi:hypothetical protein